MLNRSCNRRMRERVLQLTHLLRNNCGGWAGHALQRNSSYRRRKNVIAKLGKPHSK